MDFAHITVAHLVKIVLCQRRSSVLHENSHADLIGMPHVALKNTEVNRSAQTVHCSGLKADLAVRNQPFGFSEFQDRLAQGNASQYRAREVLMHFIVDMTLFDADGNGFGKTKLFFQFPDRADIVHRRLDAGLVHLRIQLGRQTIDRSRYIGLCQKRLIINIAYFDLVDQSAAQRRFCLIVIFNSL